MSRLLVLLLLSSLLGWTSSKSNSTTTTISGAKTYAPPAALPTGESSSGTTSKIDGLTWIYTSPEQWYSQHDLCIIKNWHKTSNMTLVEVAKTKCHQDVLADEWAGKLSIGYGHSYSATCSPPLTSRPQYMQALVGFNEPNSMHLVEAVRSMRLLNRTLVFFGDSVMRQNYIAVLAELKRLDKHITVDRWASKKLMANKTTLPGGVNVFQDDKSDLEGGGATIWLTQRRSDRATAIYYIACHRLEREQFSRAMALLQSVQSKTKGVVLVANVGLHYNERPEAFKAMSVILPSLAAFAQRSGKHNAVLWRETTAQHFEHRAQGYFDKKEAKHSHHCVPHNMIKPVDRNDESDWRNEDVKTIISIHGLSSLHYVPFYAATLPLFAMHPDKDLGKNKHYVPGNMARPGSNASADAGFGETAFGLSVPADCTHFCQLPTLWQPVWRAVADIVQEQLSSALGSLGAKEVLPPSASSSSSSSSSSSAASTKRDKEKKSDGVEHMKPSPAAMGLLPAPSKRPSASAAAHRHNASTPEGVAAKAAAKEERKKEHLHGVQYIVLNGSTRSVPVGPNFVLTVVNAQGAVVRNGIDIDTSAIVMKLPARTNVSSIRSVLVLDEGYELTRYEVRNNQGLVEGWISSNLRDKTHAKIVEVVQFCVECAEGRDGRGLRLNQGQGQGLGQGQGQRRKQKRGLGHGQGQMQQTEGRAALPRPLRR